MEDELYVYLMRSPGKGDVPAATAHFHIGVSRLPVHRLEEHNTFTGLYRGVVKKTAKGCPNWVLELVIGPFQHGAHAFAQAWKLACRRRLSRISIGLLLAYAADKTAACAQAQTRLEEAREEFNLHAHKFKAILSKVKRTQPQVFH